MSDIRKVKYYKPRVNRGNRRNNRKNGKLKKVLIICGSVIGALLLLVVGFFVWLTITEYKPADVETVKVTNNSAAETLGTEVSVITWNIGYSGLGKYEDFVLDGGKTDGKPDTVETFRSYFDGIIATLRANEADVYMLQEVDSYSDRSYHMDEVTSLAIALDMPNTAFAYNYKCNFVPFPWPPIGHVEGGLTTYSVARAAGDTATRISLPVAFDWPLRVAQLKRCVLITRYNIEGTDKQLSVINFHLEAYDSGEGNRAQAAKLLEIINEEAAKGNYIIAGGDFNQAFPGSLDVFPIKNPDIWSPGQFDTSTLPEGFTLVYDGEHASCRLLNQPYDPTSEATQYFILDGFIVSPGIEVTSVETIDAGFEYSDHNPVKINIKLQ